MIFLKMTWYKLWSMPMNLMCLKPLWLKLKVLVERLKQQYGDQLPDGFDTNSYKEEMSGQATTEAKWYFINMQLQKSMMILK